MDSSGSHADILLLPKNKRGMIIIEGGVKGEAMNQGGKSGHNEFLDERGSCRKILMVLRVARAARFLTISLGDP